MQCRDLILQLGELIDGELEAALRVQAQVHLEGCRGCCLLVETCRRTIAIYRLQPPPPLPAAFHQRLMGKVAEQNIPCP